MLKIKTLFLFGCLLWCYNPVIADTLDKQIAEFFNQQWQNIAEDINIHYSQQLPTLNCDKPTLALLNKHKKWGNVTISAQCADKKTFIPINVAVTGHYVVANQAIAAGSLITADNIRRQSGRLDSLPTNVILQESQLRDHVALRNIAINQPIKTTMVRKYWRVKAGQVVKLIIAGEGYQIISQGKSLTNAAIGETVNVRTHSGKIVEGVVTNQGVTIFSKKN